MEFNRLTKKRYSFRGYLNRMVEKEKLDYILECSRLAPSAANRQPWRIYIVTDPVIKENLARSYPREWFAASPVIVAFAGVCDENWKRADGEDYLLCDVTLAADHFILAAAEQELGTCLVASFDEAVAAKALELPANEKVMLLTPLGYPEEGSSREKSRRNIDSLVIYK